MFQDRHFFFSLLTLFFIRGGISETELEVKAFSGIAFKLKEYMHVPLKSPLTVASVITFSQTEENFHHIIYIFSYY